MSDTLLCRKCGADLEDYSMTPNARVKYCPACGTRALAGQQEALYKKTTDAEIGQIIKDKLSRLLSSGVDLSADELAYSAWESENADGVVFYDNRTADRFAARHEGWVRDALGRCNQMNDERYVKMHAECNDRFLVCAFICATEHYVSQLGVDIYEGNLSKRRIKAIIRLIKQTEYDGGF